MLCRALELQEGERSSVPGVLGVLYGAWMLQFCRTSVPTSENNIAFYSIIQVRSNLLAGYGTNVLECTSPLGVDVVLPGDEKENRRHALNGLHRELPQRRAPVSFVSLIDLVCVLPHR